MTRHARLPPTRELFSVPVRGSDAGLHEAHGGYLIDSNGETATIEMLIPWDFKEIYELAIRVLTVLSAFRAAMTFSVRTQYAAVDHVHSENNVVDAATIPIQYSWLAVSDHIQEINITEMVKRENAFATRNLNPGDMLGIHIASHATNSDNCNAYILGARLRYKVFKGK